MQRTGGDCAIVLQGYFARNKMTYARKGDFPCPLNVASLELSPRLLRKPNCPWRRCSFTLTPFRAGHSQWMAGLISTAPLHISIAAGGKFSFVSPSLVDLGRRRFDVPTASSVSSQGHSLIHHHIRIKKRGSGI
jgi:hypothetical protein